MRKNIASFSVMKELDETKKVSRIARVCCPFSDYTGESDTIMQKLAQDDNMSILDHGTAIFEVSFAVFEMLKSLVFVQNAMQTSDGNRILRFTNTNNRYLVSGSFYDWFAIMRVGGCMGRYLEITEAPSSAYSETLRSGMCNAINMGIGRILDKFLQDPNKVSYGMGAGVLSIMDMNDLTPEERMIHQRQTIWFKVSGTVAHILEKTRGASISNASDNGFSSTKMMEPLFFERSESEIAADVIIDAELTWQIAMEKAIKSYDRLVKLGVSHIDASSVLPGSTPTDLFMTMSLTQWKDTFRRFISSKTYYGVYEVMSEALKSMQVKYPFMFEGRSGGSYGEL